MKVEGIKALYIQITTRCNILCPYCIFSCTTEGEDMSFQDFKEIVSPLGLYAVMLGGGEPTVHPDFWRMFYALKDRHLDVSVVTNGQKAECALRLANLAKKGECCAVLSTDPIYKQPIQIPRVWYAFENGLDMRKSSDLYSSAPRDRRRIYNVTKFVRMGRAVENDPGGAAHTSCCCDEGDGSLFVSTKGDLYSCGCEFRKCYGNVLEDPDVFRSLPDDVRRPYTDRVSRPLWAA